YFLCLLNQKQLARSLFPLGSITKPEVRELARSANLPTAEKAESMGICFVGEVKLEKFLKAKIAERPGRIIATEGKIIGKHKGLPFYTIGQRKGLNIGGGTTYFVAAKDTKRNRLIVAAGADNPALFSKKILIKNVSWIGDKPKKFPFQCAVKIRYRQESQKAMLKYSKKNLVIEFAEPQRAATPGQYCAIYEKNTLLGGGVINATSR
ncbi:MAG: tRNA-specific 2-thiouridylase, partial [Patescibacteria group bacterium]